MSIDPEKEKSAARGALLDTIRRHSPAEISFLFTVVSFGADKDLTAQDLYDIVHEVMPPGLPEAIRHQADQVRAEFMRGYKERIADLRRRGMRTIQGGRKDDKGAE